MKYFKRLKVYKACNVTFDPETMIADSYDWWHFVERINGKVVFNNYNYSNSTSRHQSKVRELLRELGIKVDVVVNTRMGLQAAYGVHSKQNLCLDAIKEAVTYGELKRAHKIAEVFKFKLTQELIQLYFDQREEELCYEYLQRAFQYAEKKRIEADKPFTVSPLILL